MGALMRGLRLVLAASLLVAVAPSTEVVSAAQPTLAQLIGQKLVVRMEGTTPSADLLGPDPARRDRWRRPVRVEPHHAGRADRAHRRAACGGSGRRPAALPDRRRPGGRTGQADPVGSADALGTGDGSDRQRRRRAVAGRRHRGCPPCSRHRHRLRARGRHRHHERVHVSRGPDVVDQRGQDGAPRRRIRHRSRIEGRPCRR